MVTFFSCNPKLFKSHVYEKDIQLKTLTNGVSEIVFFPMHHIGKSEFYKDVQLKIDSLDRLNYLFLIEGVKLQKNQDSILTESCFKKLRKITNVDFTIMRNDNGYIDSTNLTLLGYESNKLKELVNQPKAVNFFKNDTSKYCFADVTYQEMVSSYEMKYGEIRLNDCDSKNKLGTEYKCENIIDKKASNFILLDIRNSRIIDVISKYPSRKIAIIYGRNHLESLLELLQKKDSNWRINDK